MADRREYNRQYRLKNKEKMKEYRREWNRNNRDRLNEYRKEWASIYYEDAANRERKAEYNREWRRKNPDKISAINREYRRTHREQGKEHTLSYKQFIGTLIEKERVRMEEYQKENKELEIENEALQEDLGMALDEIARLGGEV